MLTLAQGSAVMMESAATVDAASPRSATAMSSPAPLVNSASVAFVLLTPAPRLSVPLGSSAVMVPVKRAALG